MLAREGSKNAKRPVFTGRKRTPGQGFEPQIPAPEAGVLPVTPSRTGQPRIAIAPY